MRRLLLVLTLTAFLLTACTRSAPGSSWTPIAPVLNPANPATPSVPPVTTYLPPTRAPGTPISSPTANLPQILPSFTPLPLVTAQPVITVTPGPQDYTVKTGDYPGSIAAQFNISVDDLLAANKLSADSVIYPDQVLIIPGTSNKGQQPTS